MGKNKRFWDKVNIRSEDECWEWTASTIKGYGIFFNGTKNVYSHRHSWELIKGSIPEGLWVLHSCDNPPCCNPKHLFLGTTQDNTQDRIKKGRSRYVLLGEGEIWLINKLKIPRKGKTQQNYKYQFGAYSIGKMFKVSHKTIRKIWDSS